MKALRNGTTKPETIALEQKEFVAQIKFLNALIQAYAVDSKNRRMLKDFKRMQLIGDDTVIDMGFGDPSEDKILCPLRDMVISRADCLDWSGSHVNECTGCEHFNKSRRLLLGEKQG